MNPVEDRFSSATALPRSWWTTAGQLYDAPLQMHYEKLDRSATYRLRPVYGHTSDNAPVRLLANDKYEIHAPMKKDAQPLEFEIPQGATSSGELTLSFLPEPGHGGHGRMINVAEVWLIKRE